MSDALVKQYAEAYNLPEDKIREMHAADKIR
jgi:hypothetical protein